MQRYKKILLAVELNKVSDKHIIERAQMMAELCGAKISLIHIIEHVSDIGSAYGIAAGVELEGVLLERAREDMAKLAQKLGITSKDCVIDFGLAKDMILEEAERRKSDLVILGSHGRHGLGLILGSTANGVLHGAKCDVLAVRVKK